MVSLQTLRESAISGGNLPGLVKISVVTGDVRRMHLFPENAGALFQVASQFNLLEMVSPDVTPEHGVTRYQNDRTQGPACAIAAGAATIYRNYFVPIGGSQGQGCRAERSTRRVKYCFPNALGRRCLRQPRQLDPRGFETGPRFDDKLRSRREGRELRAAVE